VTDDEDDINELFVRLNRSKPLTGAEIRNAMVGPVPDVIRNISRHPFFTESIRFSVSRAGDYNAAAKLILFEYEGKLMNTKKNDLDTFAENTKIDHGRLELAARRTLDILDNMQNVFLPHDELLSSAGPVPVYFWLVRGFSLEDQIVLREFLVFFETSRKESRDAQIRGDIDQDSLGFSRYDALNRSVNDVSSHVGRYDILLAEFKKWRSKFPTMSTSSYALKE
jgi:hypothetical protein